MRKSYSLLMLIILISPIVFSGVSGSSDSDGDGVLNGEDLCPEGLQGWTSTEESDRDGDGCKDRTVIWDFEDTGDWTYLEHTFSIAQGESFDIFYICHTGCQFETTISLTKPNGDLILWGRHIVDGEALNTFPDHGNPQGKLSQVYGVTPNIEYGDNSIIDAWSDSGQYTLNVSDFNQDFLEDGHDDDNGGVSFFIYKVGSSDAEDKDDDNDGVLDFDDTCMMGDLEWIANSETDKDSDGCQDSDEDFDDDNDGTIDEYDQCTNRVTSVVDGGGTYSYPLSDSLLEATGKAAASTYGTPSFRTIDGESALYLEGFDYVNLPSSLSSNINHSDKVQYTLEFYLDDDYIENGYNGKEGTGTRVLLSNQQSATGANIGFSLMIWQGEDHYNLQLHVGEPINDHFISPIIDNSMDFGKWYSIRLTFDFTQTFPTVELIVNGQRSHFVLDDGIITDWDCWKAQLVEAPMRIGGDEFNEAWGMEWQEVDGEWKEVAQIPSIATYVRNFSSSSPIPEGDSQVLSDALQDLIKHMNQEITLTTSELENRVLSVVHNLNVNFSIIESVLKDYLTTYEQVEGLLFDGDEAWTPNSSQHLKYVAYSLQLLVMESIPILSDYSTIEDFVFPEVEIFPGLVSSEASTIDNSVVRVRGDYSHDPARSFGGQETLIQATGHWAPAGKIVNVSLDQQHINSGFSVLVGAQQSDLTNSQSEFKRLPVVGLEFKLDEEVNQIINPFGGSIYFVAPSGSNQGEFDLTISGAYDTPLFSTQSINPAGYEQWNAAVMSGLYPWVDIVSDKFITNLPTYYVNYSKNTLCSITLEIAISLEQSCQFEVQSGDELIIEVMYFVDWDEILMEVDFPNGSTVEYGIGDLHSNGWDVKPSQLFSTSFDQSGAYKVRFSSVNEGSRASFEAAILDLENALNPTEMLAKWDATADAFLTVGGWPTERGNALQALWLLPDVQTPASGTMAPASNPMPIGAPIFFPYSDESILRRHLNYFGDPRNVIQPGFEYTAFFVVWHEWGHMHNYPTLKTEVEAIANLPGLIVLNTALNFSIDDSLAFSTFQRMNRSETAIDWMVTSNFRDSERIGWGYKGYTEEGYPLDQVSYQSRGTARYADLAYMFGWDAVYNTHNVYYQRLANDSINFDLALNPTDADFIISASLGNNLNLLPFFDFWGLSINQDTIDAVNHLPSSPEVRDLLIEYRELIPKNNAEFTQWHDSIKYRIGEWQGPQVESYLATYDEQVGQAGVERIDGILCQYYPDVCTDGVYDGSMITETPSDNETEEPTNTDQTPPETTSEPDSDSFNLTYIMVPILILLVVVALFMRKRTKE